MCVSSEAITISLLSLFRYFVAASGEEDVDDDDVEAIWPMIRSKSVVGLSDRVIGSVDVVVRPTTAPPPPPPPPPLLLSLLSQGSTGSTFGNNTSPLRSLDLVDGSA